MNKPLRKIPVLFLVVILLVSCISLAHASDSTYTNEQIWINVRTSEQVVIPPAKASENLYIEPIQGMHPETPLPNRSAISPLSLIGSDGRYEVEFPSSAPFRSVVKLTMLLESGQIGEGTGFFVAPNIILTAAHNLVNPLYGSALSVIVDPSGTLASQSVPGNNCLVPAEWTNTYSIDCDYGVIIMPDNTMGSALGTLGLSAKSNSQLSNLMVGVCGFPIYSTVLLEHIRYIQSYSTYRIWYDVDTTEGQSGSPVWLMGNRNVVVGIHTEGFTDESTLQYNSGVRITSDLIAAINTLLN